MQNSKLLKLFTFNFKLFTFSKGFTLIELLVVVAIIAILAAIGFVSFAGVQKGARDAKRRGEIEAISKALEVRYQQNSGGTCEGDVNPPSGGTYCPLQNNWFSGNTVPVDQFASNTPYCIWYNSNGGPILNDPGIWSGGGCPPITGAPVGTNYAPIAPSVPAVSANATHWKVCSILEKTSTVYCINSKQ